MLDVPKFSLLILTSRFEATRELFWDGPPNFEPQSDDKDDASAGTFCPNFRTYQREDECTCDDVSQTHTIPEPDWLETEVVAGFRVWQILFLVCAGLGTLVVVVCCMTRWRIPHTRQEIEANHRRNQITQLFRCHLDRIPVDEVDLLWGKFLLSFKFLLHKEKVL
ncbi:hypothetical protein AVEN_271937-1 [Araneus ventricosus]|uniref:Uncharacterized protein n=1 Tax=Araneus ventricosus TaxID=182803 RepID=A0A4Y2CED9_ARAVE|nr:hypothetical protein AVEN_271937-1 [Araneus ventricosus]